MDRQTLSTIIIHYCQRLETGAVVELVTDEIHARHSFRLEALPSAGGLCAAERFRIGRLLLWLRPSSQ